MPNKHKIIESSASELSGGEDSGSDVAVREAPAKKRRLVPSQKQAANDKENLEAQKKKLEQLQKKIRKLERQGREQAQASSRMEDDDEPESKEDTIPRAFTSSVQPLTPIQIPNAARKVTLRRVGPASAKVSPRVSANAFKNRQSPNSLPLSYAAVVAGASAVPASSPAAAVTPPVAPAVAAVSQPVPVTAVNPIPASVPSATSVPPSQPAAAFVPADADHKDPELRPGALHNPKKPKASDFEDTVTALIIRAAFEYEALVSTSDFFPGTVQRNFWAQSTWKSAGDAADLKYRMTAPISLLLRKCGSRIRGAAVQRVRQCIVVVFGFENKANVATKAKNEALYKQLKKDSRFHYKDMDGRKGFAEWRIMSECLKAVWFEDKDSHGVFFDNLFNPIPTETIASILTMIDFCLDEWSTGVHTKNKMWEKDVIERHRVFREDVAKWCEANQQVTTMIRTKMYKRARRDAGALDSTVVSSTLDQGLLDQMRNELEGRTGETDSEAE